LLFSETFTAGSCGRFQKECTISYTPRSKEAAGMQEALQTVCSEFVVECPDSDPGLIRIVVPEYIKLVDGDYGTRRVTSDFSGFTPGFTVHPLLIRIFGVLRDYVSDIKDTIIREYRTLELRLHRPDWRESIRKELEALQESLSPVPA
jgi:hypothetical protein